MTDSSFVVDVGDETFEKEVLDRSSDVPIVVDFWAEWCGPWRGRGPTLEKLAAERQGKFVRAKGDTDQAPRLAQAFGIRSIPTVMAFRNRQRVDEFQGALPEPAVREFLARLVPSEEDERVANADAARAESPEEAEALYREVLAEHPAHDPAVVGLAELLAATGRGAEAKGLVEPLLPAGGPLAERIEHLVSELSLEGLDSGRSEQDVRADLADDESNGELWLELGGLLAHEKRYPEALEALFAAAEADRALARGRAKELMVDIFHVIGVRSELADDYRTRLARLLY